MNARGYTHAAYVTAEPFLSNSAVAASAEHLSKVKHMQRPHAGES